MRRLLRALAAARTEFDYALRFEDWKRRRNLFAALDLFDDTSQDRPGDQAVTEPAFYLVQRRLHDLNAEADR